MAKKRKQSANKIEQLSLFDLNIATENPASNYIEAEIEAEIESEIEDYDEVEIDDIDYGKLGFTEESSDRTIETRNPLRTPHPETITRGDRCPKS